MISKIRIKNFKSIIDTEFSINDNIFVLAGQNEAGKSSILEALHAFDKQNIDKENLNFEEQNKGNFTQSISVTYKITPNFIEEIEDELKGEIEILNEVEGRIFDEKQISKITEYTITQTFKFNENDEHKHSITLDDFTKDILKSAVNFKTTPKDLQEKKIILKTRLFNPSEHEKILAETMWSFSPSIILFNDFRDLLPDSIFINDIENKNRDVKGYNAVKNYEKLLNTNFLQISKKNIPSKRAISDSESAELSASFQEDWKQKIYENSKVQIQFIIENDTSGQSVLSFYVKTKDNVFLEPRKRSKGMIWFLSLWLELKGREKQNNKLILLFDEPGLHLHIKANKDMLNVFNKLSQKGHQIIYSTHLPSLIDTQKLHNIGLVLNTEKDGTIVEGLTTSKVNTNNKRDALQPIAEAMGLEPFRDFSVFDNKCVLVEGLSDFWYFQAFSVLLNKKLEYKFVPGIGVKNSKIYPLVSFCIGYGIEWQLILENGPIPSQTRQDLKENIFNNDETEANKKIIVLEVKEIEDMFTLSDVSLIDPKVKPDSLKLPSEVIGNNRKIIFARNFFQSVQNSTIKKKDIDIQTIKKFEQIFTSIENNFKS